VHILSQKYLVVDPYIAVVALEWHEKAIATWLKYQGYTKHSWCNWLTMEGLHPNGITVDIVGINASDQGRSCERHACCGCVLEKNSIVRIRVCQIVVNEEEESALAAYWVTDGVDSCRVGFLCRQLLKHKEEYHGKIAQVVEVFDDKTKSPSDRLKAHRNKGCCRAALIETVYPKDLVEPPCKRKAMEEASQEEASLRI
jgi:hypothetical protein